MKLIDIQSVTEVERGGVYEMNRQKKCQNMEMPLKWINLPTQKIIIKLYPFQLHFHFFFTLSAYPFHRHLLYPFL